MLKYFFYYTQINVQYKFFRINVGVPDLSKKSYSRKTVFMKKFKNLKYRFFFNLFNLQIYTVRGYKSNSVYYCVFVPKKIVNLFIVKKNCVLCKICVQYTIRIHNAHNFFEYNQLGSSHSDRIKFLSCASRVEKVSVSDREVDQLKAVRLE